MHHNKKGKEQRNSMRNPPEEDPEFQIAPMIDILLVLLVFFMSISSTEVLQSNREINLAVAKEAKEPKKNPGQVIVNVKWVAINNVGSIDVDSQPYPTPGDLIPILQNALNKNPMTRVLIRADREVRYEFEREILKAVGTAGVANVTFSVVDKNAGGKPNP
jgi:biopolymer transport protein ExbD